MFCGLCRLNCFGKMLSISLSAIFFLTIIAPLSVSSQPQKENISEMMEQVTVLRARGEFQRAINILDNIIKKYSASEQVLRYAYNHLVFTFDSMGDKSSALAKAREALERFPDLKVETPDIPPSIDAIYNKLRKEMFGALKINNPEKCNVFMVQDSLKVFKGVTPLDMPLVRTGVYTLEVTRSGYHDYKKPIMISPDEKYNMDVPLSRDRGRRWWATRITPVALVGSIVTYLLWANEDQSQAPQPLPGPPNPPAQ